MILQKKFAFSPEQGLTCINRDEVNEYIKKKAEEFKDYDIYMSKQKKLELLEDILEMYKKDIEDIEIDMSEMDEIVYSDKVNPQLVIQYYDFIWILGTIIYNVFDYDKNALHHTEDGINGPIDMGKMIWQAYNELHNVKVNNEEAAYGATLICVTVLESELKAKFKNLIIQEKLAIIDDKASKGDYILSDMQKDLIKFLRHDANAKKYNAVYATTQAAYDLFEDLNIWDASHKQEEKNLILNRVTLNQLLGMKIFLNKVEPAFFKVMQILFKNENLNLRNDIAHGGFGYQNYYHPSATSILYFMSTFVFYDEYISE